MEMLGSKGRQAVLQGCCLSPSFQEKRKKKQPLLNHRSIFLYIEDQWLRVNGATFSSTREALGRRLALPAGNFPAIPITTERF